MAPHAETQATGRLDTENTQSTGPPDLFAVHSPDVQYTNDAIKSTYVYRTTQVAQTPSGVLRAEPVEKVYNFSVDRKIPRVGLMLVGWGGNNGSTVTAGILANRLKLSWETREGAQQANYFGSVIMGSTIKLGNDAVTGDEVNIPFHNLLPMVHPNDLVLGGWDISGMNLADAMDRAQVLEPTLKMLVRKEMETLKPLPSIYYPDFIASNQGDRADNVIEGQTARQEHVDKIRADIKTFKRNNSLDKVIVLWTANTERYAELLEGVNDTANNILSAIKAGHSEISPSTIFATACILEQVPFINGSPQNTFVPGIIELAEQHGSYIGGDDFKSGQTKMKSALVDFLISAGIKLTSIASYNHLGNKYVIKPSMPVLVALTTSNLMCSDGKNLAEQKQFRSKEISKSNVVDDMVSANNVLYKEGEHPDHTVVIKYMPAVGDHKRALDEYYGELFMGGRQIIS